MRGAALKILFLWYTLFKKLPDKDKTSRRALPALIFFIFSVWPFIFFELYQARFSGLCVVIVYVVFFMLYPRASGFLGRRRANALYAVLFLPAGLCFVVLTGFVFLLNKAVILFEIIIFLFLYFTLRSRKMLLCFLCVVTNVNVFAVISFRVAYTNKSYIRILQQSNVTPVIFSTRRAKGKKDKYSFLRKAGAPFIPCQVQGVAMDNSERFLYLCCLFGGSDNSLYKMDVRKNEIVLTGNGKGLSAVFPLDNEKSLLVASFLERGLFVYSSDSLWLRNEITLKNANPLDIIKLPGKDVFLVLDERRKVYKVFMEKQKTKVETVTLDGIGIPQYFSLDNKRKVIFLANTSQRMPVVAIGVKPFKPGKIKKMKSWWFLTGIAVDGQKQKIYVTDMLWGKVRVLDEKTLSLEHEIPLQFGLRCATLDAERHLLYVGNYISGEITAINTDTLKVKQKFFVGSRIRKIYITPRTKRVFAVSGFGVFELKL